MDPTLRTRHHLRRIRASVAIARGETDVVRSVLNEVDAFTAQEEFTQEWTTNARLRVGLHMLDGAATAWERLGRPLPRAASLLHSGRERHRRRHDPRPFGGSRTRGDRLDPHRDVRAEETLDPRQL